MPVPLNHSTSLSHGPHTTFPYLWSPSPDTCHSHGSLLHRGSHPLDDVSPHIDLSSWCRHTLTYRVVDLYLKIRTFGWTEISGDKHLAATLYRIRPELELFVIRQVQGVTQLHCQRQVDDTVTTVRGTVLYRNLRPRGARLRAFFNHIDRFTVVLQLIGKF